MKRMILMMCLGALCALGAGCEDDAEYSNPTGCADGEVLEFEGEDFCILIEDGFLTSDCPEEFPEGEDFDGVIVCAEEGTEIPAEIDEELERRGYKEEEEPGDICEEAEDTYARLLEQNSACEVDADCQVLNGACGVGVGGCYEYVNTDLTQEELSSSLGDANAQTCNWPVCDCPDTTAPAVCNDGVCGQGPIGGVCEEIDEVYNELIDNAKGCQVDDDCQVLNGACGVGVGGCYEYVNTSITQEDLDEIASGFQQEGCGDTACGCEDFTPPPACNAGICGELRDGPPETCPDAPPIGRDAPGCNDPGLVCNYGEECCCGECYPEIFCQCDEDGTFSCSFTDACLDPECERECDSGPVCGADLNTYPDNCALEDAGVAMIYDGPCLECDDNVSCDDNQYCAQRDGVCGRSGFSRGVCVSRPEACDADAPGSCGCDGQVYTNSCAAASQGVDAVRFSGCALEDSQTYTCGNQGVCGRDQACNISFNDVIGENEPEFFENCSDLPDGCDPDAPTCDCYEGILDDFTTCYDFTGQILIFYPGG